MLTVVATVDVIVKLCVGGVTPGGVVNVSVVGLAVSTGCALAVSKQHTAANMSVPSPNKAFLVVFKTPPLKQDVPIRAKRRSDFQVLAIVLPLDSLTLELVSLFLRSVNKANMRLTLHLHFEPSASATPRFPNHLRHARRQKSPRRRYTAHS